MQPGANIHAISVNLATVIIDHDIEHSVWIWHINWSCNYMIHKWNGNISSKTYIKA